MKQNRATLFGLPNSSEAYKLRDFLKRSGFPFEWIDLKTDDDARRLAGMTGLNDPRLPVCVMEKGSVLFRPTIRDLAAALDWFRGPKHERYDLAIYGAGPAGLSAAVYGASEGLRTIVLERSAGGGRLPDKAVCFQINEILLIIGSTSRVQFVLSSFDIPV
jgi:thioredoxin reductase (NADPH)